MQEYENDRWRIISSKVGSGFSPVACRDKAQEFEALDLVAAEEDQEARQESSYASTQVTSGHCNPEANYQ